MVCSLGSTPTGNGAGRGPKPKARGLNVKGHTQSDTPRCWELAEAVLNARTRRVLFYGPPGNGKTHAALFYGLHPDQAVYNVTLTEETPAAEIRGFFIPTGAGGFVWNNGPALRGWLESARVVFNEINRASDDCLSLLLAILDDPKLARLTLPNGDTVRPGPRSQIICTMNGTPDTLPDPLADRLAVRVCIDAPHPDAIAALPDRMQTAARETAACTGDRYVSLRTWQALAELSAAVGDDVAAEILFGNRAADIVAALRLASA